MNKKISLRNIVSAIIVSVMAWSLVLLLASTAFASNWVNAGSGLSFAVDAKACSVTIRSTSRGTGTETATINGKKIKIVLSDNQSQTIKLNGSQTVKVGVGSAKVKCKK
jgi:hypothetical protein